MKTMYLKKCYTAPKAELYDFETEVILSVSVYISDEEANEGDDAVMSNKKDETNPWEFSWE